LALYIDFKALIQLWLQVHPELDKGLVKGSVRYSSMKTTSLSSDIGL